MATSTTSAPPRSLPRGTTRSPTPCCRCSRMRPSAGSRSRTAGAAASSRKRRSGRSSSSRCATTRCRAGASATARSSSGFAPTRSRRNAPGASCARRSSPASPSPGCWGPSLGAEPQAGDREHVRNVRRCLRNRLRQVVLGQACEPEVCERRERRAADTRGRDRVEHVTDDHRAADRRAGRADRRGARQVRMRDPSDLRDAADASHAQPERADEGTVVVRLHREHRELRPRPPEERVVVLLGLRPALAERRTSRGVVVQPGSRRRRAMPARPAPVPPPSRPARSRAAAPRRPGGGRPSSRGSSARLGRRDGKAPTGRGRRAGRPGGT